MRRLGYTRYVAQGGDWGAQITDVIGAKAPPELLGIHSNMPGTVPPDVSRALTSNVFGTGHPAPSGLSADEQRAYDRLSFLFTKGVGYALEMGNRPQTLYGLADSPVALAAWMLDHDAYSLEDIARAFAGDPVDHLTRDEVLDNITMTWLTNTGISSGRLYWENTLGFFDIKGVTVPAAVSVFPRELYQAPRSWTEKAYPKLIYFNELDRGNHFAAWQEPELFARELRAAFSSLRTAYGRSAGFASPERARLDEPHDYPRPPALSLNEWAPSGAWTVGPHAAVSNAPGARIAFRYQARDVNLVMGPSARGTTIAFRVLVDGSAPADAHGFDVDAEGNGTLAEQRLHQLIRQPGRGSERLVEIEFLDAGAEAYCFTFG